MTNQFQLTDEQRDIQAAVRAFAQVELRARAERADRDKVFPEGLLEKAARAGYVNFALPEEVGGGGVDAITTSIITEELAWGDAGIATLLGSSQLCGGGLVAATATDPAHRSEAQPWFDRLCAPEGAFGSIAFSEPQAGSDVANITTRAVRDGDEWVINGEKTWITGGSKADIILLFARTGGEGAGGISTIIVEADCPGVSSHKLDITGLRGGDTSSIFFSDVRVPVSNLVGMEGDGFGTAMRFFMHSRPQVAAFGLGVARAAFEYAADYANTRTAFGKPISANQGVSFQLADMGMQIEAARSLVWRAAAASESGDDVGLIGSYAKAFATDVAMNVTTAAVQVLGGAGVSADHPVGRWMRDAKVLQIVEGTNEIQRLICGRYYRAGQFAVPQ